MTNFIEISGIWTLIFLIGILFPKFWKKFNIYNSILENREISIKLVNND